MAQTARLRPPRGITLYIGIRLEHRVTYNGNFGQASLYVYYRSWDRRIAVAKVVGVERLMLTPKTIREVERCLLLVDKGRAEMKPELWAVSKTARSLRLLTRFVESGHAVIASHVLTILGGPMEQMESWGPPGSNKRRPCRVMVTTALWEPGTSLSVRKTPQPMLLGIPENYHATD